MRNPHPLGRESWLTQHAILFCIRASSCFTTCGSFASSRTGPLEALAIAHSSISQYADQRMMLRATKGGTAMNFGKTIADARKAKGLSQKDLAARILKEDDTPISPQYLNDIERDRRNAPSEHILRGLAAELELSPDYLFFLAGQIPSDIREGSIDPKSVEEAFTVFRRNIRG